MSENRERLETIDPYDLAARVVWGECRGGKDATAIACVIKNRVARPCWWGHDLKSVLLKDKQFSCVSDGDPNQQKLLDVSDKDLNLQKCRAAVQAVFSGRQPDVTCGAVCYHADSIHPSWASDMMETVRVAHHIFYKERRG